MTTRHDTPRGRPRKAPRPLRCRLGLHSWGLFKSYRLAPSVVHQIRCRRCGKVYVQ